MTVANQPNGEAVLSGPVRDHVGLFGILLKLYNLNFTLISVQPVPASTEEYNPAWDS